VAYFIVFTVIIPGIGELEPLHDLGQRDLPTLHKKVNMVCHEHIRIQGKAVPFPVVFQAIQVVSPIRIAVKDSLTLVASADDMIESASKFHSGLACHGRNTTEGL
jgi:hypothetical protein